MLMVMRLISLSLLLMLSGCLASRDIASTVAASDSWFQGATASQNMGGYPSAIKISWAQAERSVSEYRVYSLRTDSTTGAVTWTLINSVDSSQTTYVDSNNLSDGQVYTYKVHAVDSLTGDEDTNDVQTSTVTFYGIAGAQVTGENTATITLNSSTGAFDAIHVYATPKNGGGSKTLVATVQGSVSTINVTGLRSGVTYEFSVNAYMSYLEKEDGNQVYLTAETYSDSFSTGKTGDTAYNYRGVINVQGYGLSPNATSGPVGREINLIWVPFAGADSTTSYKVVRSTTTSIDTTATTACTSTLTTSCLVCTVSGAQSCADTNVGAPPQTYYYAITVVKTDSNGSWSEELPCQTVDDTSNACSNMTDFIVTAAVPPNNMVLVHRDGANYEMCMNINAYSDPRNHQRCVYNGLGAVPTSTGPGQPVKTYTSGYYDFGYNLFVDRYKEACNWTRSSTSCGPNGCTGILATSSATVTPGGTDVNGYSTAGNVGDVFYGLHYEWWGQPSCYYKAASGWTGVGVNGTSLTNAQVASAVTNDPGTDKHNPQLTYLSPDGASQVCASQTTPYGNKRLMRHREYVVSSALPHIVGEPNYISVAAQAFDGPFTAACNPTLTYSTSMSSWMSSSNTIAAMNYGGIMLNYNDYMPNLMQFIGSPATSACLSRFGTQDPQGIGAFFSDMLVRSNATGTIATVNGASSTYDDGNADNGTFSFNGVSGPYFTNGTNVNGYSGDTLYPTMTTYCTNGSAIASFIPALAIPVCAWTSSSPQTLRTRTDLANAYTFGTGSAYNTAAMISIGSSTTASLFVMNSGFYGRFSTNMEYSGANVAKYGGVFCAIEAE